MFQAGLTWKIILNKRDGFRAAFADWDIDTVDAMGPDYQGRRRKVPPVEVCSQTKTGYPLTFHLPVLGRTRQFRRPCPRGIRMTKAPWYFAYLFRYTLVPDDDKLVRSRLGQSHLTRSTSNLTERTEAEVWDLVQIFVDQQAEKPRRGF